MFGRSPRLAIDAFLGTEPDVFTGKDRSNYVSGLKSRIDFAYKVASREARKQARRHKQRYDLRVRSVKLESGDRVLIRNVGVKGKHKIADKWDRDVYIVLDQPHADIPVFRVKKEHGRGGVKTLHQNHLLPFMALPSRTPPDKPEDTSCLDSSQSTVGHLDQSFLDASLPSQTSASPTDLTVAESDPLASAVPSGDSENPPEVLSPVSQPSASVPLGLSDQEPLNTSLSDPCSAPNHAVEPATSQRPGRYVVPAKRQGLNPLARPFDPGRTRRPKVKPKWMTSTEWVT